MLTLGVDLASQRKRTATWNGYGDFDAVFSPRASMFQAWSRKGAASPRPLKLPRVSPGRSPSRASSMATRFRLR